MAKRKINFDGATLGMRFEFALKAGTELELEAKDEAGKSLTLKRLVDGKVFLLRAGDFNYKMKSGALKLIRE